jgi:hypothetical protein
MSEGTVLRLFRPDGREMDATAHAAAWIRKYHGSRHGEWPAYKAVRRAMAVEHGFLEVSDGTIRNAFAAAGRTVRGYCKRVNSGELKVES